MLGKVTGVGFIRVDRGVRTRLRVSDKAGHEYSLDIEATSKISVGAEVRWNDKTLTAPAVSDKLFQVHKIHKE